MPHGAVTPRGKPVFLKFELSADGVHYTDVAALPAAAGGDEEVSVSAAVSGLIPGVLYHYRLVAEASAEKTSGETRTFTSLGGNAGPYPFIHRHTVTTLDDHDGGAALPGDLTLREAIREANRTPGAEVIVFHPDLTGVITLKEELGPLTVTGVLAIAGPGARKLAVSGGNKIQVVRVSGALPVHISGLTVRDGYLRINEIEATSAHGAGIYNSGDLTLRDCVLTGNRVSVHASAGVVGGGGVASEGRLRLQGCLFHANTADVDFHLTAGGAALYNLRNGIVLAENCTFSGNSATGGRERFPYTGSGPPPPAADRASRPSAMMVP